MLANVAFDTCCRAKTHADRDSSEVIRFISWATGSDLSELNPRRRWWQKYRVAVAMMTTTTRNRDLEIVMDPATNTISSHGS